MPAPSFLVGRLIAAIVSLFAISDSLLAQPRQDVHPPPGQTTPNADRAGITELANDMVARLAGLPPTRSPRQRQEELFRHGNRTRRTRARSSR